MTLTLEQFNKLATKEDLNNAIDGLVTKAEFNEFKKQDFYNLEVKVDALDKKVDVLEVKVDALDKKVDVLEVKVDALDKKVDFLHIKALSTDERLGRLEEKSDAIMESVSDVLVAIDGLAHKIDKQEMDFVSNIAAHDRFETRITKVEKHLDLKTNSGY